MNTKVFNKSRYCGKKLPDCPAHNSTFAPMSNPMKSFLINDHKLNLTFRKVYCPQGFKYFISKNDDSSDPLAFEMKPQEDGKWKIILPAPDWLLPLEEELSRYINSLSTEE